MKVSIIIPIYNVSSYLTGCLDSCINQTYKDIEIICVNDGSSDNSLEIIRKYQEVDNRIVCISKKNEGLPLARKSGVEAANGDYVFHLDGDDDIPLDTIELMVAAAVAAHADIVVGDHLSIEGTQQTVVNSDINATLDSLGYSKYLLERGLFNIWGKLIRRALYTDNTIEFPPDIVMAEDLVACVQLSHYAKVIVPLHEVCYNYYVRTESMSRTNKQVVGELVDRSIHAVCFVSRFYEKVSMTGELKASIDHFLTTFLYTYLRSPYSVELCLEELNYIRGRVSPGYVMTIGNRVMRIALMIAMKNLHLSKFMMRIIMFLIRLKK